MTDRALVDSIRALPRAWRAEVYRRLAPGMLGSQRYAPALWARPAQALPAPDDLATVEVFRGGRRAGKTLCAAWLFNREVWAGRARLPRIVAATDAAVLGTVVNGASGLRTWSPPHLRPTFTRSTGYAGTLVYPAHDGPHGRVPACEVVCCSAQSPGQAIGMGRDLTFADDPAGWVESCGEATAAETFRQVRVSNSEGARPCIIVPTTRRGVGFLRRLLTPGQMLGVIEHKIGGPRDNTALSAAYLRDTIGDLEGDAWAAEELDDEDRDEMAGALWKRIWIDSRRVHAAPELQRVVVGIDPADDGRADSDETGIVVVGLGFDGRLYVLADYTARHDAEVWPAIAAWAFREFKADGIVAEMNRARSLVRRVLAIEAPNVPVIEADATRGKATRAEPLVQLYSRGEVSHLVDGPQLSRRSPVTLRIDIFDAARQRRVAREVIVQRDRRGWSTLEDELCGWEPTKTRRSPGGLDALVWAAWHLRPPDGDTWAPTPEIAPIATADVFDPYRYMPPMAEPDPLRYT